MEKVSDPESGATLVEIIVVVAVLTVAMAIALPFVSRHPTHDNWHTIAPKLATELRQARVRAISRQRTIGVGIDVEGRRYSAEGTSGEHRLPAGGAIQLTTARETLERRGSGRLLFFADGSSSGGRIILNSPSGARWEVSVDWLTGAVRTKGGVR